MVDPELNRIAAPYEAFYIEAMLFCTSAALRSETEVGEALQFAAAHWPDSREWQDGARLVVDGVQTIALQAAALSRFLWPSIKRHRDRGRHLRTALGVPEDSPIRDRGLRNQLEHLDEHLDDFCASFRAGVVLPSWVGPLPPTPQVPTTVFRAYYTDVGVFEVLGSRYEMVPVLEAVRELHARLAERSAHGGRLPSVPRAGV